VTDGNLSNSKTITINVNNVNRAPTLNSVGDKVVNENQLLTFTLLGSDPDAGEVLTYSATGLPSGSILNPNTGVFSWTPSFSQSGTYKVTFSVTDAGGLSNSKTVTITVNNVNIADLQVKVVSSDSLPAVNHKFAFMVYIKNNGPNDATNVTVNVPIPAGLTYNYYISTQGTYNGSVWTIGKIKSGSRVFLYICATPQTAYLDRSITLKATPALKEYDPTPVPGSTTIKISRISKMVLVLFSVFMLYEIFHG